MTRPGAPATPAGSPRALRRPRGRAGSADAAITSTNSSSSAATPASNRSKSTGSAASVSITSRSAVSRKRLDAAAAVTRHTSSGSCATSVSGKVPPDLVDAGREQPHHRRGTARARAHRRTATPGSSGRRRATGRRAPSGSPPGTRAARRPTRPRTRPTRAGAGNRRGWAACRRTLPCIGASQFAVELPPGFRCERVGSTPAHPRPSGGRCGCSASALATVPAAAHRGSPSIVASIIRNHAHGPE